MSLISAVFTSVVLFSIPVTGKLASDESERIITLITGLCFWIGIAGIIVFSVKTNSKRKRIEKKLKKKGSNIPSDGKQPGCISFFKNKAAIIIDVIFIVSAAVFLLLLLLQTNSQFLFFTVLSVMFLSFNLHCQFNGKNYIYITLAEKYCKRKKENRNNG